MAESEPGHEIDIFWSDEDEAHIAFVADLPYRSAWGETHEEARGCFVRRSKMDHPGDAPAWRTPYCWR